MRILLGTDTYPPDINGAAYFTQRLACGLRDRGHELRIVCPALSRSSAEDRLDDIPVSRIASLPIPTYPALRFCLPLRNVKQDLAAAVADFQPDLIHTQNHFLLSRLLIRLGHDNGVPVLATNHFVPESLLVQIEFAPKPVRTAIGRMMSRDLARVYNGATAVSAPTPTAARLLESEGVLHRVQPISCGLDLSVFTPTEETAPTRERFSIPDRPTLMFVGRLDVEKRIDELIRAVPLIRGTVDAQLVIVGQGKERPKLERLAAELGVAERVVFTGFLADQDMPHIYAACDVFCIAGTAELQSIVTLEALAVGRPVVAVNALALPHLARHGENGYTYSPGHPEELAAHVTTLLTDEKLRRRMGARSIEIAAEHDIGRTLDEFEDLHRRTAGRPAADRDDVLAARAG